MMFAPFLGSLLRRVSNYYVPTFASDEEKPLEMFECNNTQRL
jgi:hypothetical protein